MSDWDSQPPGRYHLLAFFLLALLVLGSGLGLRDPWPADEPRFALSAKQMVENGDWMFPRRGNELYAEKPPVFIWSIALLYKLTDNMRISFLLPSLLAALGTLWLTIDLGSRLWNHKTGLLTGIILLTIFQFTLQARTAQIDALLTFFTTLGIYGLSRHLLLGPEWKWYRIAFAAMGIGVITKGVGILPVLVLIPWLLAWWCKWSNLSSVNGRWWQWLSGPPFMLLMISLWLIPMLLAVSASSDPAHIAYRDNILLHQTIDRYANSWHHVRPAWYLLIQSMGLWLPITLFLPWLLPAWWNKLREKDARYLMFLGWIVLIMVFFSIPDGKRGVYLLPATPALALMTTPVLIEHWKNHNMRRMATAGAFILSVSILGFALLYGVLVSRMGEELLKDYSFDPWPLFFATGSTGLVCTLYTLRRNQFAGLATLFFCGWLLYGWWGYVILNPVRSAAPFMATVYERLETNAELGLVDWKEQLVLESQRPVKTFGFTIPADKEARLAIKWANHAHNRWLLVSDKIMNPCFDVKKSTDMGVRHRRHWYLLNREAFKPACEALKGS